MVTGFYGQLGNLSLCDRRNTCRLAGASNPAEAASTTPKFDVCAYTYSKQLTRQRDLDR
jgi:hypothetical protein